MDKVMNDVAMENNTESTNHQSISYEEMEKMNIEALARLYKYGQLDKYGAVMAENLIIRKLSIKAHQGWALDDGKGNKTFEEFFGSEGYFGEALTKAWDYAIKAYGQKDEKTGEIIPFEKHFWSAFGLKNRDTKTEYLNYIRGDEQKAKAEEVRTFVFNIAKKNGKQNLIPRTSLLKRENLQKVLKEVGGTEEECQAAEILLASCRVFRDLCLDENGEENGSYLSDAASIDRYYEAEAALDAVVAGLEKALELATKAKEKQIIKCLATLQILEYQASNNYAAVSDLSRFVDKDLLIFKKGLDKEDRELLMDYLGVKDRELRRRLARAKELLKQGLEMAYVDSCGENSAA